MIDLDTSMAPGCFGISLLYREGSNECRGCPFATQCQPLAQAQLIKLRAELGIVADRTATRQSTAASPTGGVFSSKVPVKVQELVDAIERTGVNVCEALKRGANPFTPKFPFLRVTCWALLRCQGKAIKRSDLAKLIMHHLRVGQGTADAYALQAVQALRAIGAGEERAGALRLIA